MSYTYKQCEKCDEYIGRVSVAVARQHVCNPERLAKYQVVLAERAKRNEEYQKEKAVENAKREINNLQAEANLMRDLEGYYVHTAYTYREGSSEEMAFTAVGHFTGNAISGSRVQVSRSKYWEDGKGWKPWSVSGYSINDDLAYVKMQLAVYNAAVKWLESR